MKLSVTRKVAIAATALAMMAGAGTASTVDLDRVGPGTFGAENWFETVGRTIVSNPIPGASSGKSRGLRAGLFRLTDGTQEIDAFCLEPGISLDLSEDFDTMVATSMNSDQLALVQKLYDSSYNEVVDAATAAAFQFVLWEIAAETDTDSSGTPTFDLMSGNHAITSASSDAYAAGATFLANLSSEWEQRFKLTTYVNDGQDLVSVAPVPVPASALLLLAGVGGLAAMRRRKTADA